MVEILPPKQGPSGVVESISDMLLTYAQKKQRAQEMSSFTDFLDIPKSQKEAFLKLPSEFQEKLIPSLISQAGKKRSEAEKIPIGSAQYLEKFHPELYEKLSARNQIKDLSQKYFDQGFSPTKAYEEAVKEYKTPKQKPAIPGQTLTTAAQEQGEGNDWRDFFGQLLSTAQQKKAPEHPMTTLERERPGGTAESAAIGALTLLEEPLRYQSKPAMEFAKSLGFTYPEGAERGPLASEKWREKQHAALSPEARKATQFPEIVGGFAFPAERLVMGLAKIGKNIGFLRNAEKLAASKGIEVAEAVQNIAKEAEAAGIDLAKAAEGDKQEAGKLFNLSNRISREAPETATKHRIARTEPERRLYPTKERASVREAQLKEFDKLKDEIAKDAAERAKQAESRIPKTDIGKQNKKLRIHEAEKKLPKAEEDYYKSASRVRALEDELVFAGKKHGTDSELYKHLEEITKLAQKDLSEAQFGLKQALENTKGLSPRSTLPEMREAAQKKLLEIQDAIAAGEEYKLSGYDYSPKMIEEAKSISKRKPVPSTPKEDFYNQVHETYIGEYRKRLGQLEKEGEILKGNKDMASLFRRQQIGKEKDIINKMIQSADAERVRHYHKFGLRETAERHKIKKMMERLEPSQGKPQVTKIAKEKFEEAIKNPESKAAEDLVKEAKATKEDFKEAKSEFADSWEKVKQETGKTKEAKGPKAAKVPPAGTDLMKELKRTMRNIQKKRFFHIFMKTPVGREILYTLAVATANDAFGLKINPYLQSFVGRRIAMTPVRAAVNQIYHWINPKKQIFQHRYRNAVEREDKDRVPLMKKQHPTWAKEAMKQTYED